jgi:hypothetical protein
MIDRRRDDGRAAQDRNAVSVPLLYRVYLQNWVLTKHVRGPFVYAQDKLQPEESRFHNNLTQPKLDVNLHSRSELDAHNCLR